MSTLRIGTRRSALALIQTHTVAAALERLGSMTGRTVELIEVTTEGDRNRRSPLAQIPQGGFRVGFESKATVNAARRWESGLDRPVGRGVVGGPGAG